MASKKFKYNVSALVTLPNGTIEKFATQLYQIGVYIIWNDRSSEQGSMTPAGMQKMCKKIQKDLDAGKLTKVEWGREITVEEDENKMWKEVN